MGTFSENLSGSVVVDSTGTILTLPDRLALHFGYHKGNNLPMATTIPFANSAMSSMAFDAFTSQDVSDSLVEKTSTISIKHKKSSYNGILKWDTVVSSRYNHYFSHQLKIHL